MAAAPAAAPAAARAGGRRLRIAGLVLIGLGLGAALAFALYGIAFGSRRDVPPVVFSMPGSTTATLSPGEYGLYSPLVDGAQSIAYPSDIAVVGPSGEVVTRQTFGLFSDPATVVDGGTTYEVFNRFSITEAGSYEVTITRDSKVKDEDGVVPVLLATYVDAAATAVWVVLGIGIGAPLAFVGLVLWFVGLLVRANDRKHAAMAMTPNGRTG